MENKVANALSRNAIRSCIDSINSYKIELDDNLEEGIKLDTKYQHIREKVNQNVSENINTYYSLNEKGLMLYKNRLYVPNIS